MRNLFIIYLLFVFCGCSKLDENSASIILSFQVLGQNPNTETQNSDTVVSANKGDTLLINGENFYDYTAVYINNFPCEIIYLQSNNKLITVIISDNATTGKVKIETKNGSIYSKNDIFIKVNSEISSFSPKIVVTGDNVKLTGKNFFNVKEIFIGTVKVTNFEIINNTEITIQVPQFEINAPIKIVSTDASFTTTEQLNRLTPPTVASIRPLKWTSVTSAVISGTNLNAVYKAELNGKLLQINNNSDLGEEQSNIRMILGLKSGINYTSGNIVLTNVAGSYTTANEVQIIENELIANFDTQIGLYYDKKSDLTFTNSSVANDFFDVNSEIKSLPGFYFQEKQFLVLTGTPNTTTTNKKGKWTVNRNALVIDQGFFNRLKGGNLVEYSILITLFGDDINTLNLELFAVTKNADNPSSPLKYNYNKETVIAPGRAESSSLEFSFLYFNPVEHSKSISLLSIKDLLGFELTIAPSTTITQNYSIRIESLSASGPAY